MAELEAEIEEVKSLLSKELSVKKEKLSTETRLLHDLGIDGDDGLEFMEVFAKHFQVDMTGFEPDLYFGEEAGADPFTLFYFLIFKSKRRKFIPVNIRDLAVSAKKKKWIKPKTEAVS